MAWSLYARGIVKVRQGDKTGGDADIAAAVTIPARHCADRDPLRLHAVTADHRIVGTNRFTRRA